MGDRVDWVRTATRADNWASADPPGAYYVLNGLAMEDMVRAYYAYSRRLTARSSAITSMSTAPRSTALGFTVHSVVAATNPGEKFFQEISERIHWAIRTGRFVEYPEGAFWIINPLNEQDTARIMRFLDRDHLDELIANRENAAASGVPNALRIVREANNRRRDGAKRQRKSRLPT